MNDLDYAVGNTIGVLQETIDTIGVFSSFASAKLSDKLEKTKEDLEVALSERKRPYLDMRKYRSEQFPGNDFEFEDSTAAEILLREGVLFVGWGEEAKTSTRLLINCNDLFYWGSADAEEASAYKLEELYLAWEGNKKWGTSKFCCMQRGLQPQTPIVRDMKADGFWDDELEALPAPHPS